MELNRRGRNRFVFLTRRYAFKVPSPRCWRDFLFGLLNNMNEARRSGAQGTCPVLWSLPGGFLVVMPRARILTEREFCIHGVYVEALRVGLSGVECKADSFGWVDDEIVCVDYGWPP